jgi:hypothetical protein
MRVVLFVLALVLAVSGCSDDKEPPPSSADDFPSLTPTGSDPTDPSASPGAPTSSNTPPPGVSAKEAKAARRTFDTWLGAFAAGDGDRACPLQTPRFTQQQIKRLAERDRIERGATCGQLVEIIGILFEALQLRASDAAVSRAPSNPDEVAFAVVFKDFAQLGYALIHTPKGWRVDQDLTAN